MDQAGVPVVKVKVKVKVVWHSDGGVSATFSQSFILWEELC